MMELQPGEWIRVRAAMKLHTRPGEPIFGRLRGGFWLQKNTFRPQAGGGEFTETQNLYPNATSTPSIAVHFLGSSAMASHAAGAVSQQPEEPVATVFQRLQSPTEERQAAEELLKRGRSDSKVREYIALHLPPLIESGPVEKDHPGPWIELVCLAGELKIPEAAPALTKWLTIDNIGEITTASFTRLENNPAGAALVQIGDPAVPAIVQVLDHGTLRERRYAAYALNLISSVNAKSALQQHLDREPDKVLRDAIRKMLAG